MIKINETAHVYGPGKTKKAKKSEGADFEGFLGAAEEAEQSAPAAPAMPVSGVNPLLSLQEVSEEESRRQRSLQQGRQSIDILEQLRREILTGQASPDMIARMQQQVDQMRQNLPPGPKLQEIMSEIELRLAVEAAKLEKINFSA